MTHDEAKELLPSMAIDALDPDTLALMDEHLLTCPECQTELNSLREVAAGLGGKVASALSHALEDETADLWSQIATRLHEPGLDDAPSLPILLSDFTPARRDDRRRTRRTRSFALSASLAAAAAIVALGLNLASANGRVSKLENAHSGVAAALATPGHQVVTLTNLDHRVVASFVLLPDGRGYLVHSTMPVLPSDETYQLWGIVGGSPVSIGLMGASPRAVAFTLASSPTPSALAITIEPAGGSRTPAKSIAASGAV